MVQEVQQNMQEGNLNGTEYNVYPPDIKDPYRTRRRECGKGMYNVLQVEKSDLAGKLAQVAKNFDFFGAPMGIFFATDRQMGMVRWLFGGC